MQITKKLQIKSKFSISKNIQFLIHHNYIISLPYGRNAIDFYDIKTFRRKFFLKPEIKMDNINHGKWDLIYTKQKKLFLFGKADHFDNLDIYLLDIDKRKYVKKASFYYSYSFIEDKNNSKLYILSERELIVYDFNTEISNKKKLIFTPNYFWKSFLIDNYLLLFSINNLNKDIYSLSCDIIDKNLKYLKKKLTLSKKQNQPYFFYDDPFVKLSDNLISVTSYVENHKTIIEVADIRINQKVLDETKDELIAFDNKEIKIKKTGYIDIYPLNKEKCGIAFDYKVYYICNLSNMEITLKMKLNINEELFLLKFKDDNGKYEIYMSDYEHNKILFIS